MIQTVEGGRVEMGCVVTGRPVPEVQWSRHGMLLPAQPRHAGHHYQQTQKVKDSRFSSNSTFQS